MRYEILGKYEIESAIDKVSSKSIEVVKAPFKVIEVSANDVLSDRDTVDRMESLEKRIAIIEGRLWKHVSADFNRVHCF